MALIHYGYRGGLTEPSFGKRTTPPALPAYECWSPVAPLLHRGVIFAPDSFQARQSYAAQHCGMEVVDVAARRIPDVTAAVTE